MLDEPNVIKQRDPSDYLGFAAKQPEQLHHNFGLIEQVQPARPIYNVVFAGMGGSSLVAELVPTWPGLPVPFSIVKGYQLPSFVDQHTLVLCSSYSGNTEETIACLQQARKAKAQIVVISFGGKLHDMAREGGEVYAKIPHCPQPRAGVFFMYRAVTEVFVAAGLVPKTAIAELEKAVAHLEDSIKNYGAKVPQAENLAKKLAHMLIGKTPIVYGGALMYPAAYKWKIDINETAKNTAWCNAYPEFNHNEMMGWTSHPIDKPFAVIDLLSSYEHPRTLKRFEVSDRLLSGMRPKAITVHAKGSNVLEHLLYLVLLGDFASTYMAILNGVDPTPVGLIEKFKKELG